MGAVVICGGGVIGLMTATMLARDGHDVTVLESDPAGVPECPEQAWSAWDRRGVAQFRQPHNLFARFREVCDAELPGLTDDLLGAGCVPIDPLAALPPSITDRTPRPGDERVRFVTGRRPVVESVVAAAAAREPGVEMRRGTRVAALLAGPESLRGVPHVAGVRTSAGEELRADLVVDATGRRSVAPSWLAALGARPVGQEAEDRGFVYYTRYFTGPERPVRRGPALFPLGSVSLLTLEGDNDTWSVTVFGAAHDRALRAFRDPGTFTRVVAACPLQAHWLAGTPITEVLAMGGILDRHRRFSTGGTPVATGFVAVGDAWACTNPSAGRGLSVGAVHAQQLRAVVRAHLDDPAALARAFEERTERSVRPFHDHQLAADRVRMAEMTAARRGEDPPPATSPLAALVRAAARDADAFRGMIDILLCLAFLDEVLARPAVAEALAAHAEDPPPPTPGPDRRQLVELLAA
ncbi:FAD-dependent oxidoreductase [Actinomycetospora cinnamomea]|uniref:2-polyprenyl-6-methoxyphenol hydroxylase-like FAD-dependent oxidoreductase n=1 Tax=Actinomycetospora cinnamomea TaxID=663609 RepID=A0A2U1FG24_9PSEU|nr:FAD-dependent oxidoreductase [Actinomycetospora cinnamomea]PVZ11154.1 2-polyprenyl-6-methoxyphenol hydroxylase-like FAD-dependent oxidoreductase [Actinomycetospora cinnamomea]